MKLTKQQLKQIIKEELQRVLKEQKCGKPQWANKPYIPWVLPKWHSTPAGGQIDECAAMLAHASKALLLAQENIVMCGKPKCGGYSVQPQDVLKGLMRAVKQPGKGSANQRMISSFLALLEAWNLAAGMSHNAGVAGISAIAQGSPMMTYRSLVKPAYKILKSADLPGYDTVDKLQPVPSGVGSKSAYARPNRPSPYHDK